MARASRPEIEVSVVIPCLNEEKTISAVVTKALRAIKDFGIRGEVVVSDNGSTDTSVALAKKAGARVVNQPLRGYGNAYLKGFAEAKGKYLLMGDADDTYDFLKLQDFIEPLRQGYDFVIGDRLHGEIKPGAMPWHHKWIGNPVLSGLVRLMFRTDIKDSHCGMRAFTREAYESMNLHTTGMEFASEMVIRAAELKLKVKQIPITLYARPAGSESKLHSFRDGWRHLRFMLLYSPLWLFTIPGSILIALGGIMLGLLAMGPILVAGVTFDVHPMFIGSLLVILGYQTISLGLYARVYRLTSYEHLDETALWFKKNITVDRGLIIGLIMFLTGLIIDIVIFLEWMHNGFGNLERVRAAIIALTLVVIGVQTMFSACFLGILSVAHR